jgi:Uma2 family endonuclease
MATIAPTQPVTQLEVQEPPALYRFTVDEYERMVLDDPRVELIDGHVVRKMGKKPPHSWCTKAVRKAFDGVIPPGFTWRAEQPVRIPDHDEPEPDYAIVRGSDDDYQDRHPAPADVALLVEISETSILRDRGRKLSAYGKARIPVYWIINMARRQVEVYTDPRPEGYGVCTPYQEGQNIPVAIAGVEVGRIPVDRLLPRRPAAGVE